MTANTHVSQLDKEYSISYYIRNAVRFCSRTYFCCVLCRDGGTSAKDLSQCVELLLQLDEPAEELCDKFLSHAQARLESDLQGLEAEIAPSTSVPSEKEASARRSPAASAASPSSRNSPTAGTLPSHASNSDILEFIDRGCNEFVSSLCLVITSYQELFVTHAQTGELASKNIPQMANNKLQVFVDDLATCYFSLVERRIQEEKGVGDNSLLVRALDRFHRRLQAVAKLLPGSPVPNKGAEIVKRAATERVKQYLTALQSFYMDSLTDVRQALATPRLSVANASGAHHGGPSSSRDAPNSLPELLSFLSSSILNQIKSVLASVHLFTAKDISFSNKPYFKVNNPIGHSPDKLMVMFPIFVLSHLE